jgi:CubicO group peptidase (beta-lactamase class C family)
MAKCLAMTMRRREFVVAAGRATLGVSLLPFAACSRPSPTPGTRDDDDLSNLIDDLESQIPELLTESVVPGLSMAIISNAAVQWRRGFGVKDAVSRAAVGDDTVFEVGSVSKTVFAYAVMKLCEKGALDLDTPLTKYSSDRFLVGDPRLDLITARHVLTHTSGFQNWRSAQDPLSIHFPPGSRQAYSGEGYSYLQSVVSHLTGVVDPDVCSTYEAGLKVCATGFDQYMKSNLLGPFGMTSSGYVWNDVYERRAARPHDAKGTPFTRKATAPDAARYGAAGGLLTTPGDYAKFLIEIIAPKESDAFRLTEASLEEMLRPQVTSTESSADQWALGWGIQHQEKGDVITHGGSNPGFQALIAASVRSKSGFVIATNGDNGFEVIKQVVSGDRMKRFLNVRV